MKIDFETGNKQLRESLERLKTKVEPAATATSLNRTATHVIAESRRELATAVGIPQKHFRKRIKVKRGDKATARRRYTTIWAGTWDLPVRDLTPKPRQLKGTGRAKYKTLPGEPLDPNAFVAKGKKGVTAFARKGNPRLPIKQKTLRIGPIMGRKIWLNLGPPARRFYEKTLFQEIDGRIINEFRKLGMKVR